MVVKEDLWLPFTFIRVLTMSVTVKRIVSTCDFPEISEQLAVTGLLTRTHARTHARKPGNFEQLAVTGLLIAHC